MQQRMRWRISEQILKLYEWRTSQIGNHLRMTTFTGIVHSQRLETMPTYIAVYPTSEPVVLPSLSQCSKGSHRDSRF
jgi:hypothetical protein